MQPEQPYYQPPTMPPVQPNPQNGGQFDFIMGNAPKASRPVRSGGGKTWVVVLIGAVVVIGLLWLILSLVTGGGGSSKTAPLVSLAQTQTEIARVAKSANDSNQLRSQDVKNFAQNTQLSMQTDEQSMVDLLKKNGVSLKDKQLALKQNSQTDSTLKAALGSDTYDSTFVSLMQTQLQSYQTALQQAYSTATSQTEKKLLSDDFNHVNLLLQQSGLPQASKS